MDVPLQRKTDSGCSSARLEYASGGRVVASSNLVTPTQKHWRKSPVLFLFAILRNLLIFAINERTQDYASHKKTFGN